MIVSNTWTRITQNAGVGGLIQKHGIVNVQVVHSELEPVGEPDGIFILYTDVPRVYEAVQPTDYLWAKTVNGTSSVSVEEYGPPPTPFVVDELKSMLVSVSTAQQDVYQHDGTSATETIVNFGSASSEIADVLQGIVTFNEDVSSFHATAELHFLKGERKPTIAFWLETSIDSGVSWQIYPDSLRSKAVDKIGSGLILIDFSASSEVLAGTMVRMKATNIADGEIEIVSPPSVTADLGVVTGFATKLTIMTH